MPYLQLCVKKFLLLAFAATLIAAQARSQFFEWTKSLGQVSAPSSTSMSLTTCTAGYNGEVIATYVDHSCLMCTHRTYINKINSSLTSNWSVMGFSFPFYNERLMSDGYGGVYMMSIYNSSLQLDVSSVYIQCLGDTVAFIKYSSTTPVRGKWYRKDKYKDFFVAYSGHNYLLTADSLEKNDSAGVVQWKRATGGTKVLADSLDNYFIRGTLGASMYNDSGVLQWSINMSANAQLVADVMVNQVYVVRNDSIFLIDKASGSISNAYRNYAGNTSIKFDSKGNYYINGNKFSLSNGFLWDIYGIPGTSTMSVDKDDNVYAGFSLNSSTPHNVFVPPSYYSYSDGQYTGSYWSGATAYKINNSDSINNATITTGNVKAICADGQMDVPFTVNNYYIQYLSSGFSVELSDSGGSFANPLVIGSGNRSPIRCTVPFFNAMSNNYSIRVVSNTVPKVIGSSINNLTAYQPFSLHITPSNYNPYQGGYCTPLTLTASPSQNITFSWYYQETGNTSWEYSSGGKTCQANAPNILSNYHTYKVEGTDVNTGCMSSASIYMIKCYWSSSTPPINLPAYICLNAGPIHLNQLSLNGEYSGAGISGWYFYPDSAGYGSHSITYTTFDTVSCMPVSWSTTTFVDSCSAAIITHAINDGLKTKFCAGDTLVVPFSYDTTLIPPGTWFYLYLSNTSTIIDSTQTSPFNTVIPNNLYSSYYYPYAYNLQVKTLTPYYAGTLNYGQAIEMYKLPDITSFTANNNAISCTNGTNILLNIKAPGYVYSWHHDFDPVINDTTQRISNYPFWNSYVYGTQSNYLATAPGYYWVEVFNPLGCSSVSDSIFIADSSQFTNFALNLSNSPFCAGDSALITLTTDTLNTITWYKQGSVFSPANPFQFYVTDTATYSVKIENNYGCERQQNIKAVLVNPIKPLITTTASGNFWLCEGDSMRLRVSNNFFSNLQWYKDGTLLPPGATSYSSYISDSGYYYVTATYSVCPVRSDSVFIEIKPRSVPDILTDSIFSCSATLPVIVNATATNNSSSYNWILYFTGTYIQSESTLNNQLNMILGIVPVPGLYTLKVNNLYCNGTAYDSVYVGHYNMPNSNIYSGNPLSFCIGDSALLQNLNVTADNIQWFNNSTLITSGTQPFLTVYQQGNYFTVTTDSFCVDTSNVLVVTTPCITSIKNTDDLLTHVNVLPNPANDIVTVEINDEKNNDASTVELFDTQLKLLEVKSCKTHCSFDVSKLHAGVYMIKVSNSNWVYTARVFKI